MGVPGRSHVNTVSIPVPQYRFGDAEQIQEHQRTPAVDEPPPQLSKMDAIGGGYPLANVHRSVLVHRTAEPGRLAGGVFRRLAGPDEPRRGRHVEVDHVGQRSDVDGVLRQRVAVAVVRVAEQHEQVGRRRSEVLFEYELLRRRRSAADLRPALRRRLALGVRLERRHLRTRRPTHARTHAHGRYVTQLERAHR